MIGWYVVNKLPPQEAQAESNLLRQGYRIWLPSIRRSRRHARLIETILAPLFPRTGRLTTAALSPCRSPR
jgi:transcriptional antiterminator RfaH